MQKDFRKDTWENFRTALMNRKLYIWGAGQKGREIARLIQGFGVPWQVNGFIDHNPDIHTCEGYPVYQPQKLIKLDSNNIIVLISPNCPGKIAQELEKIGIKNYYSYFWLMEELRDYRLQTDMDVDALSKVESLLSDEYSKTLLQAIVKKRQNGILDYTDIMCSGPEYFRDEFFKPSENEIFVDAGGFDGDTVEDFIVWTGGRYQKVYSFEADIRMSRKIEIRARNWHDIKVYPYGLWGKREMRNFQLDNVVYSSRISESGIGIPVQCVPLDEILKNKGCTFLKMDIEGAEVPALHGAYHTIINNTPKLAICIYHLPADLWEIPMLIHKWVPEYKLYMRHFGARYFSTVLFATL